MGTPIRKNKYAAYSTFGPIWVITTPSGPSRWSLSRTMITAPSGPYRPLFRTLSTTPSGPYRPLFPIVSTAPSGPYSFLYPLLRFMQT